MSSVDEKDFLDLLQWKVSDDTVKAGRNLSLISFVIISIPLLGLSLSDLNVFGLKLAESNETAAILLAGFIIGYWSLMYYLHNEHDLAIKKEQTVLIEKQILHIRKKMKEEEVVAEKNGLETPDASMGSLLPGGYGQLKKEAEVYAGQRYRTKQARSLGTLIENVRYYFPFMLAFLAAITLACGLVEPTPR